MYATRTALFFAAMVALIAMTAEVMATPVSENFDAATWVPTPSGCSYIAMQYADGFRIVNGVRDPGATCSGFYYSSPYAVRLNQSQAPTNGVNPYIEYISSNADSAGKDGGVGTLSFMWKKWSATTSNKFIISYKIGAGAWLNIDSVYVTGSDATWHQYSRDLNLPGDNITVRVTNIPGGSGTLAQKQLDIDDFYIGDYVQTITMISPNGGEIWAAGEIHNITWAQQNLWGTVNIGLKRTYPTGSWEVVASNVANSGSYSWTVTGPATTAARMRVISVGYPSVGDTSDLEFSIRVPTTKVWNNASGGSWFTAGNWTPSGVPDIGDTVVITHTGIYTVTVDLQKVRIGRLMLGNTSGVQMLRIIDPTDSLILTRNSVIYHSGRINVGQKVFAVRGDSITLTNNGVISVDSSGCISLGSGCHLSNQTTGTISLNGSADILGGFSGQVCESYVDNSGIMNKTGGDTLSLYCVYNQTSTGTFALQAGMMRVSEFTTDGLVTLSSGTATFANETYGYVHISASGIVDLQGTASISVDFNIENLGELRHTLVGNSVISAPYLAYQTYPNSGTVRVLAGKLSLTGMQNNVEGLVVISPSGELDVSNGTLRFSSVTSAVTDSGTLTLAGNSFTTVLDSFPFSGALQIRGNTVFFNPATVDTQIHVRSFSIDSGATFESYVRVNARDVNMSGGSTNSNIAVSHQYNWTAGTFAGTGGSSATIDPGVTLSVSGPISKQLDARNLFISGTASMSGSGQFSLTQGASVIVNSSGSLTVGDSITVTGTTDSLINKGHTTFSCPHSRAILSTFLFNKSTVLTTPGTIDILSGRVTFGSAQNDGIVNVGNGATADVGGWWYNNGSVVMNDGSTLFLTGTMSNSASGVINMCGGADIVGGGWFDNSGQVTHSGSVLLTSANGIINATFHNVATTGHLEIIADTLTLALGGSNEGDINIHSGAILRVLGTFVNETTGTIRGGGTLDISNAIFTNNGNINPGASPGTLSVIGALNTQGTINVEIAGRTPGAEYDRLLINGSAALGGTLHLSLLNGFVPTLTDTFRCLTCTGHSGQFAAITGTPVGNGTYMEVAYHPTEIVQYVCNGVSGIAASSISIVDTIHRNWNDMLELQLCNQGHCPLEWTTEFVGFTPHNPDTCPQWNGVVSGESGLLTRGQCMSVRVVVGTWGTPSGTYTGQIRFHSNDPGQPIATIPVQIVVPSNFDVGGDPADFSSFGDALQYLSNWGVFEPTVFNFKPATYGAVTIPAIMGASAANTVTFRAIGTPPEVQVTSGPALMLDGADHVIFDRFHFSVYETGGTNAVWLTNGADSNVIRNSSVVGPSLTSSGFNGIYADGLSNDGNLFERDTISNSTTAIYLGGGSTKCVGNEVSHCYIPEARYGIYLVRQTAKVHDNDIQPGFSGATVTTAGVYLSTQAAGDTAFAYNNRIHNFRSSGSAYGVYESTSTMGFYKVYNNFIYDWQNSGSVYGIYLGLYTQSLCCFNSIRINDVTTSGTVAAMYDGGSPSSQLTLSNNILEVDEPTSICYSIYRSGGTLTSNDNCFYGTGTNYFVGRNAATNYQTLSQWRSGTGFDGQSKQGDPVFYSSTDLHINPFASYVDSSGVAVAGITTDIDGDLRAGVPDMGADEYTYSDGVDNLVIRVNLSVRGVDLIWGSILQARSYKIYRTDPLTLDNNPTILVATTADTTYTHSGVLLSPGHLTYKVVASTTTP